MTVIPRIVRAAALAVALCVAVVGSSPQAHATEPGSPSAQTELVGLGEVLAVDLSPDGKHLVVSGADKALHIYDVATGKVVRELEGHGEVVQAVRWLPDGKHLAAVGEKTSLRIWPLEGDAIKANKVTGSSVGVSNDGKHVLVGNAAGQLTVVEATTGEKVAAIDFGKAGSDQYFAPDGEVDLGLAMDGARIAVVRPAMDGEAGDRDFFNELLIFDRRADGKWTEKGYVELDDSELLVRLVGGKIMTPRMTVEFARDGEMTTDAGKIPHASTVLALSVDGTRAVTSSSRGADGNALEIVDVASGKVLGEVRKVLSEESWHAVFSSDGNRMMLVGGSKNRREVEVWPAK